MDRSDIELKIIANSMVEPGMSGGNRIFIELSKYLRETGVKITVFTSSEGKEICLRNGLAGVDFVVWKIPGRFDHDNLSRAEVLFLYIVGLACGSLNCLLNLRNPANKKVIVWSTSDYWPDFIPGLLTKVFGGPVFWISSLLLFAPNPLYGFHELGRLRVPSVKHVIFYLTQKPVYFLMRRLADLMLVTSQTDKERCLRDGKRFEQVEVLKGGVDATAAAEFLAGRESVPKEFEACFMGRFHEQKGVLELVDIWDLVCQKRKLAKLALIGDGELMDLVKRKIREKNLEDNVTIFGFLGDGKEKFNVFKKSRIVVHPALYDSGGMAAAEAMAWGLPGVSFDLISLRTYYPRGMLKAKVGDLQDFSDLIVRLIEDGDLYENLSLQARTLVFREWRWSDNVQRFLSLFTNKLSY